MASKTRPSVVMFVRLACTTPPAPQAPPALRTATASVAFITTQPQPACNVFRVNSTLSTTSINARTVLQENTLYTMKLPVLTPAKSARRASTLALGKHCVQTVLNTPTHPTAARQKRNVPAMLGMGLSMRRLIVNTAMTAHSNSNLEMSSVKRAHVKTINSKSLNVMRIVSSNAMTVLCAHPNCTPKHHVRLTKAPHASEVIATPNVQIVKCVELAPRN